MSRGPAPAPLTPADCDLGSHTYFPLYYKRLKRSKWWKRAGYMAKAISVMLWCEAYEQIPAGSLENDDHELAEVAGFGLNIEGWLAIKPDVMAPWILCSDGRWYHPTVAEVVLDLWEKSTARRAKWNAKKRRQRARKDGEPAAENAAEIQPPAETSQGDAPPSPEVVASQRRGEESKKVTKGSGNLSVYGAAAAPVSPPKADKRGSRIPVGWTASAEGVTYAVARGFTLPEVREMEDAFFDFWKAKPGQGGTKLDWAATWRTWVRNEAKRRGGRNGPGFDGNGGGGGPARPRGGPSPRQQRIGSMLKGAMAAVDGVRRRPARGPGDQS